MRKIVFLCLILLGLTSCSSNHAWTFTSSDKQVEIKVVASRPVMFDPYEISVQVKGYENEKTFITELNNMGLKDDEVTITWTDDQHCTLTFIESDDKEQKFLITVERAGILVNAE